jgi:hypothetical protein
VDRLRASISPSASPFVLPSSAPSIAPSMSQEPSRTPSAVPTLSSAPSTVPSPEPSQAPSFCELSLECNITFAEDDVTTGPDSSTKKLVKLLRLSYSVENTCVTRDTNVTTEMTYCDDYTISNFTSGTLVEFEYSKECDLEKIGIRNYIVCDNFVLNVTATDGFSDLNCLAYPPPVLVSE